MKEYKLVYLNKGVKFSREKDLEQAETIITNARKEIDRERTQAEKELRDSIVDMTIDAAEKISGKSFTKEDHAQLISESISMIKEV